MELKEVDSGKMTELYEAGTRAVPIDMPKYARKIFSHYARCFAEERCILCLDCIAYAMGEVKGVRIEKGRPYSISRGRAGRFIKFLTSTLPGSPGGRKYNPCERAEEIKYDDARRLAKWILKLSEEKREILRSYILCHAEFHEADEKTGVCML